MPQARKKQKNTPGPAGNPRRKATFGLPDPAGPADPLLKKIVSDYLLENDITLEALALRARVSTTTIWKAKEGGSLNVRHRKRIMDAIRPQAEAAS